MLKVFKCFKGFSLIGTGMSIAGILEYGFRFETGLALTLSVVLFLLTSFVKPINKETNAKDKNKRIWKCIKIYFLMLFRPVDNIDNPLADKTYVYGFTGIKNIKTHTRECSYKELWKETMEYIHA